MSKYKYRQTITYTLNNGDTKRLDFRANSKQELNKKIKNYEEKLKSQTTSKETFGYYADIYLKNKKSSVGLSQWRAEDGNVRNHLKTLLNRPISSLEMIDFIDIFDDMFSKGYAKKTIKSVKGTAKQIFDLAVPIKVPYNFIPLIKINKLAPQTKREPVSDEILNMIINLNISDKNSDERKKQIQRARAWVLFAVDTGLRKGEIAALLKSDLKTENGITTVEVHHSYSFVEKRIKEPKTNAGNRYEVVHQITLDAISEINSSGIYLFSQDNGEIISDIAYKHMMTALKDEINGISVSDKISFGKKKIKPVYKYDFTPHQLRHNFCTNLAGHSDIDLKTMQFFSGHASAKTFLDRYSHFDKSNIDKAKNILAKEA